VVRLSHFNRSPCYSCLTVGLRGSSEEREQAFVPKRRALEKGTIRWELFHPGKEGGKESRAKDKRRDHSILFLSSSAKEIAYVTSPIVSAGAVVLETSLGL